MPPPTRRTRQLLLRAPARSDFDALFAIQGNPTTMRFTYCSPSRKATAEYVEAYAARFEDDGFAPWALDNSASIRVLARAGFVRDEFVPELQRDRFRITAGQWSGPSA